MIVDSIIGLIVFIIFCSALFIQLWYYIKVFSKLGFYSKKDSPNTSPPASIIICSRNEDDNLIEFLPSILQQDYPLYEVVVVNDCSSDNTNDILNEFAKKYSHLKIVTIKEDENYSHGKKLALMIGIKGAQHEHLLLTDADCKPQGKNWLKHMMSNFSETTTEIVLGYGAYEKNKGFLNKLIRFDTFYIALQYLSCSLIGKTYMGVGRNLAYRKSLFFKHKGFASHYHIESGDDDLFINEVSNKSNTKIEIFQDTFTISKAKKTYKAWFQQKRRHITTGRYYKTSTKINLGLLMLSQYLFFILFIVLLILQYQVYIILSLFSVRILIQLFIFKKSMEKLGEKDLLLFSPLLEVFVMFFYPLTACSNLFLKKNKWKK